MVDACSKNVYIKAAEEIFVSMVHGGSTFNSWIDGCAKHGEVAETKQIYETMRTGVVAGSLINDCSKHIDIKAAQEIFVSVLPDGATLNNLIDGCAKHGVVERTEEAIRTVGVCDTALIMAMSRHPRRSSCQWFQTARRSTA